MLNALLAAAIATAPPSVQASAQPPAEDASPAMFMVRDADTTVYIFGTFHALDGKADWFKDRVKAAFDGSGELILETVIPEGKPIVARPGFRGPALSVTPSASFLATTRMAISAGKSQGMQVGNGADNVLRHVAEAQGKPVQGLETLELQLNMFNKMPAATAAPGPKAGQPVEDHQMQDLTKAMAAMQNAWKHGDQSVFVKMLGQLEQTSPDTYRMMFTERNARWADWIAGRMQTPGTIFVAVGAGHLAGKDSLLVRLAEHGITSSRLN
jgi:uncharacterized protein YbaP (TraB family)